MQTPESASPINPLPWIVWALALPMIAMEAVFGLSQAGILGGASAGIQDGFRLQAIERFSVIPEFMRFFAANEIWSEVAIRLLAYPFIHGSFMQALFAVVLLLALGKMVAEIFRWWAVVVIFFASALLGGLAYLLVPSVQYPLFGGFPAVYGLIGAFTFLLWANLGRTGGESWRAFTMIGMLMGVQLLFGALFGGGLTWVADLAGFATGFALSFVLIPGGWAHLKERLRRR